MGQPYRSLDERHALCTLLSLLYSLITQLSSIPISSNYLIAVHKSLRIRILIAWMSLAPFQHFVEPL